MGHHSALPKLVTSVISIPLRVCALRGYTSPPLSLVLQLLLMSKGRQQMLEQYSCKRQEACSDPVWNQHS